MAVPRSELLEHLVEQRVFLDASADAFDAGRRIEAKRLATTVRTLCHTVPTTSTRSLLTQLGEQESMLFSRLSPDPPGDEYTGAFFGGLVTMSSSPDPYAPVLKPLEQPSTAVTPWGTDTAPVPFEHWWRKPALRTTEGAVLTRREVMHWLANKHGGTHIDDMPPKMRTFHSGEAMGLRQTRGALNERIAVSPLPEAMRTIAEELRISLQRTFDQHSAPASRQHHS